MTKKNKDTSSPPQKRTVTGHSTAKDSTSGNAVPETRPDSRINDLGSGPIVGHLIGYARVSSDDGRQDLAPQLAALRAAGATKVITDESSGKSMDRPGWRELLEYARDGDTVLVWRLDRLGRVGIRGTLEIIDELAQRGVGLRSLTEHLDVTGPVGQVIVSILAWAAEQERLANSSRTKEALALRKAQGVRLGRPPALTGEQKQLAADQLNAGKSVREVARLLGVSKSTVGRIVPNGGPDAQRRLHAILLGHTHHGETQSY